MARLATYVIWFGLVIGITVGVHYFFWVRLVRDPGIAPPWRAWLTGLIALLGLSLPLAFVIGRYTSAPWRDLWVKAAFVWMGVMFFLLLLLLLGDLGKWLVGLGRRISDLNPDLRDPLRRLFVARLVGGGATLGALGLGGVALAGGMRPPPLKKVRIGLRRLSAGLDGFSIVQISDLHVGQPISRDYVEDVVRRTNALQPDLIAITGDLVDGGTTALRDDIAPIAELRAKHGVFFVTGNHEYYAGVGPWLGELGRLGLRVLRNQHVIIEDERGSFVLAGVDDHMAHRMEPGHGEDVAKAVAGAPAGLPIVLLAHQPRTVFRAAEHGVDLQLSGHTHGGQLWPFTLFVRLVQPYIAGLARHGATQIYVSRGTGHWGPPMRLAAPSELTAIEIFHDGDAVTV